MKPPPFNYHRPETVAEAPALTRAGGVEPGIDRLRKVVRIHPGRDEAWDALLTGLDESGQIELMEEELAASKHPVQPMVSATEEHGTVAA